MERFSAFVLALIVAGCSSTGATIKVSSTDTLREVVLTPCWVCKENRTDCSLKLGLTHRSTQPDDQFTLTAMVPGLMYIGLEKSLLLNIDGSVVELESTDTRPDPRISRIAVNGKPWTARNYQVSRAVVEQMMAAKSVTVKLNLASSYVNGVFSQDGPELARPGFREFIASVDSGH